MSDIFYAVIKLKGNPYGKATVESGINMMRSVAGAEVESHIYDSLGDFMAAHVLEVLAGNLSVDESALPTVDHEEKQ